MCHVVSVVTERLYVATHVCPRAHSVLHANSYAKQDVLIAYVGKRVESHAICARSHALGNALILNVPSYAASRVTGLLAISRARKRLKDVVISASACAENLAQRCAGFAIKKG